MRKTKKKTTSQLKKDLDKWFSLYIRQSHANKNGYVYCYTCNKYLPWKESQCGHFVSRVYLATRFDERNVRPQCVGCNVFGDGKTPIFAEKLENETPGITSLLYKKANEITKDYPYISEIERYKGLLEKLSPVV